MQRLQQVNHVSLKKYKIMYSCKNYFISQGLHRDKADIPRAFDPSKCSQTTDFTCHKNAS